MKEIKICPQCKKPVEAKHYFNPGIMGVLESVLPSIQHDCGYQGLPISVKRDEYEKLRDNEK